MVLLPLICLAVAQALIKEQDTILILDDSNFEEARQLHPGLLVQFFAPWCGHCKALAPQYKKAATLLMAQDPPVRLAKIDATVYSDLANQFEVKQYPTLFYFLNNQPIIYQEARKSENIVSWVLKLRTASYAEASTLEDLQAMILPDKIIGILFAGKRSVQFQQFEEISRSQSNVQFVLSTDQRALAHYSLKEPSFLLFNPRAERKVRFSGKFRKKDLTEFIQTYSHPYLVLYGPEARELIIKQRRTALVVFRTQEQAEQLDGFLERIGVQMRGTLVVSVCDMSNPEGERLASFMGVSLSDFPVAVINAESKKHKYKLAEPPSEENVKKFISDLQNKLIKPFWKSESPPRNHYANDVRVLVGSNFKQYIYDRKKDVLVMFYSPDCIYCKAFMPEFQKLAQEFRGINSLLIAKIDMKANEIFGIKVTKMPTIVLYSLDNKNGITFDGVRNLKRLREWLIKQVTIPIRLEAMIAAGGQKQAQIDTKPEVLKVVDLKPGNSRATMPEVNKESSVAKEKTPEGAKEKTPEVAKEKTPEGAKEKTPEVAKATEAGKETHKSLPASRESGESSNHNRPNDDL